MESPETSVVEPFLGSWSLVSWRATTADGNVVHPLGEDAFGRLMYLREGGMAACLMRRERTLFASDNRLQATVDECTAAYREYFSYFGSFTVQPVAGTVTHHVQAATYPNWVGQDQVRNYRFSDTRLTLSLVSTKGARHVLVWERLPTGGRSVT